MPRNKGEQCGATPLGSVAPALVQLTVKERQILEWAAMGKTAWEIARIQKCSEATVHFHTSNIRRKFDVHSLSAALVMAIRQGVISVR
ncbi:helix-turn-helix domain-containing protein [Pseudomonas syringae]|uniref:Helix-turn-helix transcriptional regulator n=2 Tax=Pseudomonas syringae group TaxID=136849 RepID=A0A9Q4A8J9_PSESX|nr:helix-turn-helix domain-containing protein [Pseudomonas syringae]KTB66908.1 LuxR family transcriptional regulator [Pseudomonas viridiflava ICMP 13104]KTB85590.1 LuxR family transcriptional regulator [Pseudomonas syringae pv. syringae PD2766]MCF5470585.1 helix-turn-helix transcriptional regulator [Pseudomonas syringae]MCF5475545.1 helix-turn-helix transcriptional regulator [Pseudomonas syringae]MCF5485437.1 helix-turn-helix transcriptional regulator [Pseudomonas syringae]